MPCREDCFRHGEVLAKKRRLAANVTIWDKKIHSQKGTLDLSVGWTKHDKLKPQVSLVIELPG